MSKSRQHVPQAFNPSPACHCD